ncbi:MAG: GIY-YIG nuclease family protein, partial [Candidatus Omnitrophota bacterium]
MVQKEKIIILPQSPGVYIMKGEDGRALYVGKAINLRKRVASYFSPKALHDARIGAMVQLVEDIDYISTSTEAEALIYEN